MVVTITTNAVARSVAFLAIVGTSLTSLSEVLLKIFYRTTIGTICPINEEVSRYTGDAECLKSTKATSWVTNRTI
jgi:hypothetical protein